MKILVAAGGTGGHITPGIAIANRLKEEGHQIIFVGTERGMEVDLIPKAGFDIKYIHAQGIRRGNVLKNIKTFTELIKGIDNVKKGCFHFILFLRYFFFFARLYPAI